MFHCFMKPFTVSLFCNVAKTGMQNKQNVLRNGHNLAYFAVSQNRNQPFYLKPLSGSVSQPQLIYFAILSRNDKYFTV